MATIVGGVEEYLEIQIQINVEIIGIAVTQHNIVTVPHVLAHCPPLAWSWINACLGESSATRKAFSRSRPYSLLISLIEPETPRCVHVVNQKRRPVIRQPT
jgi:hypothetical protein